MKTLVNVLCLYFLLFKSQFCGSGVILLWLPSVVSSLLLPLSKHSLVLKTPWIVSQQTLWCNCAALLYKISTINTKTGKYFQLNCQLYASNYAHTSFSTNIMNNHCPLLPSHPPVKYCALLVWPGHRQLVRKWKSDYKDKIMELERWLSS